MLSDFLKEKDSKDEAPEIKTQIKRLENLSISMSNLIASGNSDKIMHLEKIRKKIITDIIITRKIIPNEHKDSFKNLIYLNDKIINEMKIEKKKKLQKINKQIKFAESTKSH